MSLLYTFSDVKVSRVRYKSFSGCKIEGVKQYKPKDHYDHMNRAVWLTAQVEGGGKFGAINSYDGTAMSAGLEHNIAVYPRSLKQGSLWRLIKEVRHHTSSRHLKNLLASFEAVKWFLDDGGTLRHKDTGKIVSGKEIRNQFTPPNGSVPSEGQNWQIAKEWAILFHRLLAHKSTHDAQVKVATESLINGNGDNEAAAYNISLGVEHPTVLRYGKNIDAEHDLAWCVYHSFSVNAPGMARKRLRDSNPDGSRAWAKRLITTLGKTHYGRWHDTFDGGNRYDRTRYVAQKSGFWPTDLFFGPNAIMPKNLR